MSGAWRPIATILSAVSLAGSAADFDGVLTPGNDRCLTTPCAALTYAFLRPAR